MDKKTLKTVLDTYGVDLGDVSLEIRGNSKNPKIKKLKHMDNISEDEILNMLYEGDDERRQLELVTAQHIAEQPEGKHHETVE